MQMNFMKFVGITGCIAHKTTTMFHVKHENIYNNQIKKRGKQI